MGSDFYMNPPDVRSPSGGIENYLEESLGYQVPTRSETRDAMRHNKPVVLGVRSNRTTRKEGGVHYVEFLMGNPLIVHSVSEDLVKSLNINEKAKKWSVSDIDFHDGCQLVEFGEYLIPARKLMDICFKDE